MHDFHTAQDDARKQSNKLVAMFIAAVLVLLVLSNALIAVLFVGFDAHLFQAWQHVVYSAESGVLESSVYLVQAYLTGPLFPVVSTVVLGGVGIAALLKRMELSHGGHKVAEMLGGTRLDPDTRDALQRKLLNVVEEMAIASGTPVPAVYLLPEESINAFAAGFSADDAVIGVTRAAVERLTRDELQGVIAHEFSHILNGDMRLNMRLISALGGIVFIATAGRVLMHSSSRGRSSRGSPGIAVLGLGLMLLGWAGVFSGRLIKAAVSRQREYLADASAVQFTRHPQGLAGALKKIGGLGAHGVVRAPKAEEISHLFFAQAVGSGIAGWLATHPPLQDRILRLDPRWRGELPDALPIDPVAEEYAFNQLQSGGGPTSGAPIAADSSALKIAPLPETLRLTVRSRRGATVFVIACLCRDDERARALAREWLPEMATEVETAVEYLQSQPLALLVPGLELAMPSLQLLDDEAASRLRELVRRLAASDGKLDLTELLVASMLERHVKGGLFQPRDALPRYRNLRAVDASLRLLLAVLLRASADTEQQAAAAMQRVQAELSDQLRLQIELDTLNKTTPDWAQVISAMNRLRGLYPLQKPRVIKACRAALGDLRAGDQGAEAVLRLLAAGIDCPLPPGDLSGALT